MKREPTIEEKMIKYIKLEIVRLKKNLKGKEKTLAELIAELEAKNAKKGTRKWQRRQ